jgi:heat shock protein HslJ
MKFLILILTTYFYHYTNAQPVNNLIGTRWSLIKITDLLENYSKSADTTCGAMLHFDDDRQFGGFTGWNSFSGKYSIHVNNEIKMDSVVQTLMAGPPNCEFGETSCGLFNKVKIFFLEADNLMLYTNDSIKITYKKIK